MDAGETSSRTSLTMFCFWWTLFVGICKCVCFCLCGYSPRSDKDEALAKYDEYSVSKGRGH